MSEGPETVRETDDAVRAAARCFEEHLGFVETAALRAASRAGFSREEAEDFMADVRLKLLADDYAVLRQHRGVSSLKSFLLAVIANHLRDLRNHRLGKYRPVVESRRQGVEAVELDRLVRRDGFEVEVAVRMVRERYPRGPSAEALQEHAARLPDRVPRRFLDETALERHGVPGSADDRAREAERQGLGEAVQRALERALTGLEPSDAVFLTMIFRHGLPISHIARAQRIDQRSLYSRRDRCLRRLRKALHEEGLAWDAVRESLGFWDNHVLAALDSSAARGNPADESVSSRDDFVDFSSSRS